MASTLASTLASRADGASPSALAPSSASAASSPSLHASASPASPATPMSPLPASPLAGAPGSAPGARLPQNIAHRGFRARFPENSMSAFRGALASGAVALETDVHLSKDKVVVLSHDPTLRRCFGRPERIADCDWSFLQTLRTTRDPDEPMARLADLLVLLSEPGREHVWVLLDIKRDDDAEELVARMADAIRAAPGDWSKRIVLGCWDATYMRHAQDRLPGFAIAYIGVSLAYSYELLEYDCVGYFNLLQGILVGPRGTRFLREAHARHRSVLVWTVNTEEWMDWSVRKGVDGVITDDPAKFADIRKRWEGHDGDDDGDHEEDGHKEGPLAPVSESTPLRSPAKAPPTAHPPSARSLTGLFLRRWAKLYAIVGLVRLVEQAVNGYLRIKYGWEGAQIRAALER